VDFWMIKLAIPLLVRLYTTPKVFKNYLNTKVVVKRACEKIIKIKYDKRSQKSKTTTFFFFNFKSKYRKNQLKKLNPLSRAFCSRYRSFKRHTVHGAKAVVFK
jgi:DNA replication protein DnaC